MEDLPEWLKTYLKPLLSSKEQEKIIEQFSNTCRQNQQVFWTGMTREQAQSWADDNEMQTLTTAMGPLMDPSHELFAGRGKGPKQWAHYIHGASAILSWHVSQGDVVTVLTNPPPEIFNPAKNTSFQQIEWPILTGEFGNHPVGKIQVYHPLVPGAKDFSYQLWPDNEAGKWEEQGFPTYHPIWRKAKKNFKDAVMKVASRSQSSSNEERKKAAVTEKNKQKKKEQQENDNAAINSELKELRKRHNKEIQELREMESTSRKLLKQQKAESEGLLNKLAKQRRKRFNQENDRESSWLSSHHKAQSTLLQRFGIDTKRLTKHKHKKTKTLSCRHEKENQILASLEARQMSDLERQFGEQWEAFGKRLATMTTGLQSRHKQEILDLEKLRKN